MTRHQTAFFRQILLAVDVLVSAAALVAALAVRGSAAALPAWVGLSGASPVAIADYGTLLLGLLPLWLLVFRGLKTGAFRHGLHRTIGRYVRAVALGLVLLVVAQWLLRLGFVSRGLLAMFGMLQLVALVAVRAMILAVVRRSRHVQDHRVLVVGCGETAVAFARTLRDGSTWHHRLLGHVAVPGEIAMVDAAPCIGHVDGLAAILDGQPVDEVVFAVSDREHPAVQSAIEACDVRGVEVLLMLPAALSAGGVVELASVTGFDLPMIGWSRRESAPMLDRIVGTWLTRPRGFGDRRARRRKSGARAHDTAHTAAKPARS